jgi:hypothetical protein
MKYALVPGLLFFHNSGRLAPRVPKGDVLTYVEYKDGIYVLIHNSSHVFIIEDFFKKLIERDELGLIPVAS